MKKNIFLLILLAAQINFAQNTFPTTGNVGIGTTLPASKLEIVTGNTDGINFKFSQGFGNTSIGLIYDSGADANNVMAFKINNMAGSAVEKMRILGNGNVGIGTFSPSDRLQVAGQAQFDSNILLGHMGDNNLIRNREVNQTLDIGSTNYTTFSTYTSGWNERMRIDQNGNVGIGTVSPDEKLTVKGKIHTQEVRVDLLGPLVPDYVFASDYKLKSLPEVEKYIKQNSHLPEIPSAKEIEKNGLMLAEMNMSLLKKVEELTLYAIEQNKKMEQMEKDFASLRELIVSGKK